MGGERETELNEKKFLADKVEMPKEANPTKYSAPTNLEWLDFLKNLTKLIGMMARVHLEKEAESDKDKDVRRKLNELAGLVASLGSSLAANEALLNASRANADLLRLRTQLTDHIIEKNKQLLKTAVGTDASSEISGNASNWRGSVLGMLRQFIPLSTEKPSQAALEKQLDTLSNDIDAKFGAEWDKLTPGAKLDITREQYIKERRVNENVDENLRKAKDVKNQEDSIQAITDLTATLNSKVVVEIWQVTPSADEKKAPPVGKADFKNTQAQVIMGKNSIVVVKKGVTEEHAEKMETPKVLTEPNSPAVKIKGAGGKVENPRPKIDPEKVKASVGELSMSETKTEGKKGDGGSTVTFTPDTRTDKRGTADYVFKFASDETALKDYLASQSKAEGAEAKNGEADRRVKDSNGKIKVVINGIPATVSKNSEGKIEVEYPNPAGKEPPTLKKTVDNPRELGELFNQLEQSPFEGNAEIGFTFNPPDNRNGKAEAHLKMIVDRLPKGKEVVVYIDGQKYQDKYG